MKRAFLLLVVALPVIIELVLLEGFLPYQWHHHIAEHVNRVFPTLPYQPHPNMDWEIETILRDHPFYRIAVYLVNAVLATGNALLIAKLSKARKRLSNLSS